jgi:hypothetical protein
MLYVLLFFMALGANNQTLFAANNHSNIILSDTCYAPAPDSFRITSVSSNFIALAWESAWSGAEQTLSVLKRNPTGAWEMFLPPFTVQGEAYTVGNLTPGVEYRFIIATNCGPDEPSSLTKVIDGITLILELTIGGRTPINPVPVDCHNINYLAHEWVGFKVETISKEGQHVSSLFEFQPYGDISSSGFLTNVRIKRVDYSNPIVATNEEGKWPLIQNPIVLAENPFRMGYKKANGISTYTIGYIDLTVYSTSIDLCVDDDNLLDPWRQSYEYTAMTAESATGVSPTKSNNRDGSLSNHQEFVRVQCPFNDFLEVFLPLVNQQNRHTKVSLINTAGQVLMEQIVDENCTIVSFYTGNLAKGIYFIRIESTGKVNNLRTIKVN